MMRRYALLLAAIRYAREKSATLCYGMSMYRAGLAPKLGVRAEFDLILSEAKLQRSGRSLRGQAFNLGSFLLLPTDVRFAQHDKALD